jgi:uncharacterized protein (TIGR01319 family)
VAEERTVVPDPEPAVTICVDFGSTFTKAMLVDLQDGRILAAASHRTTIDTDVLDGYDACLAELSVRDPRAGGAPVLACSSAGGGLRIAVVGNESLVTAEAGRRVALSSGGKVVLVSSGGLDEQRFGALLDAEPDVVLLVGGTDGGNSEVLVGDAAYLSASQWSGPVVVAGNVEARADVARLLTASHTPHVLADNVVPRIGVLAPVSARSAIREMFLVHVIGGKHLSPRTDFAAMVRGATPDVVLRGVELLARGLDDARPGAGDVVVVDVGGATTDVHSVIEVDPEDGTIDADGLSREVVASTPITRTVEGDLGMRWSAVTTVAAMGDETLVEAAAVRLADPSYLPQSPAEIEVDEEIAAGAVAIALRRHAGRSRVVLGPDGRVVERSGKDLREIDLLVGSGGVLRNGRDGIAERVLGPSTGVDFKDGWQLPRSPRVVLDVDYVLAAAGLLAPRHPEAAYLLTRHLGGG